VADRFYITSAIYYANDVPHVGHTYEIVACDVLARFHRLKGDRTWFLTGSDEHSQNVLKAAVDRGLTPQEWTDQVVPKWQDTWKSLDISFDDWIRTSEDRHVRRVQKFVNVLYENGDVYLGSYEGPYCVSCEEFKAESDLLEGDLCPIHRIPVQRLSEENYFFSLSKYQDRLLAHYEANPEFVRPETRRNEVVSFVRSGLKDLSISRPSADWGVPVPWDPKHVIYVWVDALLNYATAVGYGEEPERFAEIWPANVHMIGKDIIRFHAVIWPAMLMATGVELPHTVLTHGFLNLGGEKMSKTRGTMVYPAEVLEKFGVDSYRWFLMREVQFGQDGNFSWESMLARHNAELANGIGNLASRVLAMLGSYFAGQIPEGSAANGALAAEVGGFVARYRETMDDHGLSAGLAVGFDLVSRLNGYLVERAPWALAKQEGRADELAGVLYEVVEALRIAALLLWPVMPEAMDRLWADVGEPVLLSDGGGGPFDELATWGRLTPGTPTRRGEPLFPRLELEAEA
jgi:methionyl-tRNA synthetase